MTHLINAVNRKRQLVGLPAAVALCLYAGLPAQADDTGAGASGQVSVEAAQSVEVEAAVGPESTAVPAADLGATASQAATAAADTTAAASSATSDDDEETSGDAPRSPIGLETDGEAAAEAAGTLDAATEAVHLESIDVAVDSAVEGEIDASVAASVQQDVEEAIEADLVTDVTDSLPLPGND